MTIKIEKKTEEKYFHFYEAELAQIRRKKRAETP